MLMLVISSTVATPNEVQGEFAISGGTFTGIFSFLGVPGWVVSIVKGATIVYAVIAEGVTLMYFGLWTLLARQ